ncbi:MAG: hypothetical protein WCO26_05480 [Deltaproteobacteria bacterium]
MSKRYCGGNRRCNVIVEHIADPPKALHLTAIPLRPIAAGELVVTYSFKWQSILRFHFDE